MPLTSLIPIRSKPKTTKMPYDLWIEYNEYDLNIIYRLIKNYNKDIDFLDKCEFNIFCNLCYEKSSGIKQKYF
jgi:hypothetical protein